jgi:alanine-glyoxylate transaminase/serine-glyoxylate transaminase/serine-pyruvate transaminase
MAPPRSPEWHHFFRIGHMGHINAHMVLGALATIEAGLSAVGIAHRPGGIGAAAEVVAAHA